MNRTLQLPTTLSVPPMSARSDPLAPRPTHQLRSVRTQERILAAAEALMAEGRGDRLAIEELAERAHVSVGAIYKRFQGKASLLPLVLERVQATQCARLRELTGRPSLRDAGLAQRIAALLDAFAHSQLEQRHLIRTLLAGHWQATTPSRGEAGAAEVMGLMRDWLDQCRSEIRHPDPALALSLGLFTTLQTLQNAILMERIPPSLGLAAFVAEISRLFQRYLGLPDAAPPPA